MTTTHITSIASKDVKMPPAVSIINGRMATTPGSALDAVQANMNLKGTIANHLYSLIKAIDVCTDAQNGGSVAYDQIPNGFHVVNGKANAYDWVSDTIENALAITYHTTRAGGQIIIVDAGIYYRNMANGAWSLWRGQKGNETNYSRRSSGSDM